MDTDTKSIPTGAELLAAEERQNAWLYQQKEAVFVNGFQIAEMGGMLRLSFTEKTRADLPISVRAAILVRPEEAGVLADTIKKVLTQLEAVMANGGLANGHAKIVPAPGVQ